jgi:thiol-disulfide isomerase/thioredoxin
MLWIWLASCCGCNTATDKNDYLRKVSGKLSRIKSASYFVTETVSLPEDTVRFMKPRESYYKIFLNPSDTLVGSKSAWFAASDTTKALAFYDGKVGAYVEWDKKPIEVDSFKTQFAPFRVVHYPFYPKVNEMIKYALSTKDSIRTDFVDYGDSVRFSLWVINQHMYFHIKPVVLKNEYIPADEISYFDVWISKSDDMPYKMRSRWYHTTAIGSCYNAKFNTTEDIAFDAKKLYPSSFKIVERGTGRKTDKNNLIGKKAPDWVLKDTGYKDFNSADFKGKVLLVQFTGIGCGPCHHSIPFLKKLVNDYKSKDFEFISIETWSDDMEDLKRYQDKNGFNFKFLKASKQVKKIL